MTPGGTRMSRRLDPTAADNLRPEDPVRAWYDALLKGGFFAEAGPDDVALLRVQAALDALRTADEETMAASLPPAMETGGVPHGVWVALATATGLALLATNLLIALAMVAMLAGAVSLVGLAWRVWIRIKLRERRDAAEEARRRAGVEIRAAVDAVPRGGG